MALGRGHKTWFRGPYTSTWVSAGGLGYTWVNPIIEVAPVVEPDLDQTRVVLVDDAARAAGERVWRHLAEHVTHVRARVDVQRAAALPHLCTCVHVARQAGARYVTSRHRTVRQVKVVKGSDSATGQKEENTKTKN